MTWEPTNELRWIQGQQMMLVHSGNINEPAFAMPQPAPRLQQKWRWAHGTDVYMEPAFEWRDVPTEIEEPAHSALNQKE
jgi:hypothetical protein